jgi:hypothetical protein
MTTTDPVSTPPVAIALARDLMFVGRINATARAAGAAIKTLRDPTQLKNETADHVIVDLELPGAIEAVAEWKRAAAGRSATGFVSHVAADVIAHARSAGIDTVMARGRFVEILPDLLARLAAAKA